MKETFRGVYAGDPSKLSMKAAFGKVWKLEKNGGSIIGGTFKAIQEKSSSPRAPRDPRLPKPKGQTVGSFKRGLVMLPNAISSSLGNKVKLSWRLTTITTLENGGYLLTYETPSGMVSLRSRSVVMTVPSYVASTILRPLSAVAADALLKLYYPPVAAVTISYPKEAIRKECLIDGELKGFGQLHPRSQGVETLEMCPFKFSVALDMNSVMYSRLLKRATYDIPTQICEFLILRAIDFAAPKAQLLMLDSSCGGLTKSQLVDSVDRDLRKMLINTNAPDPLVLGVRVWPQAIPQFMIGHLDVLDTAQNALSNGGFKGLFLGGNYVSGVALGRCVEGAYDVAEEVTDYLSQYVYRQECN
ncbi:Protoporphyrinogen oxidase, chloroplastic [Sesamum angolense]|uniref:Protoporphyrinogen oxidase n=1 Tax=Sesamum angolense TaxID=2727404 RepID=A0AAE1X7Q3_9LAMI|nr:Protoporphyrinogen oxidase, chloroplastic [Sesamum angolense]